MGQLLRKAGSLTLAIGALALVLFNAAVTHGCGGARSAEPAAHVAPDSGAPRAPEPTAAVGATSTPAAPDPVCLKRVYMHATKAPVWMAEDECRGRAAGVEGAAQPAVPSNAPLPQQQQQAP